MRATATNHPISWFKREADSDTLDLSPTYQRRPLWDEGQASYLIDSILGDFPIPEVYIRSEADISGTVRNEVIDGQQRIRSILLFAEGELELHAEELSPELDGITFDALDDDQKTQFWNYKIVVRELAGASDTEIKELFRRVNLNTVELNDQELRHAHYEGRFIQVVEDLADDAWWVEHRLFTVREIRRMVDVEFISELLVGLIAGPQNKKDTLDEYYDDYDGDFEDEAFWKKIFKQTRDVIEALTEGNLGRWRGKSEFYSLFLVVGDLIFEEYEFDDEVIEDLSIALMEFREQADQAKKRDNKKRFPADIHLYADAVTRAATDLSRRTTRDSVLRKRILDVFEAE